MRVLLTADALGGVFSYAVELARALAARGADVAIATTGRALAADQRAALAAIPRARVFESAWRLEWMEAPWDDVARTGAWLSAVARAVRPDVVHLNEYAHAVLPLGAPKLVVAHSCVASWFEAVRGAAPPPSFDRYRAAVRAGLAGADLVVAPTRAMLAALARHHGPLGRTAVIPNAADPRRFPPGRKEALVLCAARLWDEAKGAADLAAVAPSLPWPVLLAGEARHPDAAHGGDVAPGACRALGRLAPDALAAVYARAAVYALPARYEPFGLSALEAALAGCALVLGDVASLRETWHGAALFVRPGDRGALAAALRRLCARPRLRAALARRARARALRLRPERMAAAYLDAYRSLAAGEAVPCAS